MKKKDYFTDNPQHTASAYPMQCCDPQPGSRLETTGYNVFPGIEIFYHHVHIPKCSFENALSGPVFEINHCREGRMERAFHDEFYYLAPGDLSLTLKAESESSYFPLSHYQGISILIHIDSAPKCLSCFLDDVRVSPRALTQKFCAAGQCFVIRSHAGIEHIFSELYSVPDLIKKGYFKIKILELLLFLSDLDIKQNEMQTHSVSKAQALLAKEVGRYLSAHMEKRITLEMLSEKFHASGTSIKSSFKAVYGVSLYSYTRMQKMQAAALMLENTSQSILEIAGKFGYENGSKFAKAFQDCMGKTPHQYRQTREKV